MPQIDYNDFSKKIDELMSLKEKVDKAYASVPKGDFEKQREIKNSPDSLSYNTAITNLILISPVELITYLFLKRDIYQADESLIDELKEKNKDNSKKIKDLEKNLSLLEKETSNLKQSIQPSQLLIDNLEKDKMDYSQRVEQLTKELISIKTVLKNKDELLEKGLEQARAGCTADLYQRIEDFFKQ
ncbi:hypothetical protein HYU21_03140 [Candidatus Woesearchaeota archaeon]|nr:hypothetical protein [Candidatus Woesearchaeota archaeon]